LIVQKVLTSFNDGSNHRLSSQNNIAGYGICQGGDHHHNISSVRIVQKPVATGNGDRSRRHWQYPDPFSKLVLIHPFRSWSAVSTVAIAATGKRLAPVIIHGV